MYVEDFASGEIASADLKQEGLWLMLGDCLERMKEIPDGSVDMVLADPPYGTTQCKWDSIIDLEMMWEQLKRISKKDGAIVLMSAQPFTSALVMSNAQMFKYQWVWEKSQGTGHLNAWKQPMRNTEDLCVFYAKQCIYRPILVDKPLENRRPLTNRTKRSDNYGYHKLDAHKCPPDKSMPATIIRFNNAQGTVHPTQKPVPLMEYMLNTYTKVGDCVLDFTMGSGTTGVACANLDRKFIGIEMDEGYFNIAKERILKGADKK